MENANFERGEQLFQMGRHKEAISYLKNALSEDIDNFSIKYLLAQSYFLTDNIDKAYNLAIELRGSEPDYYGIYLLLSQLYLHKEDDKEAMISINKAISLNPYDETNFGQKAYVFLSQKKFTEALKSANEGLRIDAKDTFCLNARATALTKLKRNEEADQTIENLLNDDPENAYSHANVGWSFLESNNHSKARKHFKEALALDPNSEYARSGMLTSIKAKNPVYRLFLKYSFWMSNRSETSQWAFIIGLYLVYRFSVKILSATGMTYLAIPIIIAYLFFALGSWIMDPLSNSILLFDNYGKYLLDNKEKLSGQLMVLLACLSLGTVAISFVSNYDFILIYSLAFIAMIIPLTRGIMSNKKSNQIISISYSILILLVAIVSSIIDYNYTTSLFIIIGLFAVYTWIGNLISD